MIDRAEPTPKGTPCPACGADLWAHYRLVGADVPPVRDGSRIVHSCCPGCGSEIAEDTASGGISCARGVAVNRRVNHLLRMDPTRQRGDYYD